MPRYNFECDKCKYESSENMAVNKFLELKKEIRQCTKCDGGVLLLKLSTARNKIERRKEDIIEQIKDDVRKTLKKVESGDERAIIDVFGDTVNPNKK